jgi:hypothetical protein
MTFYNAEAARGLRFSNQGSFHSLRFLPCISAQEGVTLERHLSDDLKVHQASLSSIKLPSFFLMLLFSSLLKKTAGDNNVLPLTAKHSSNPSPWSLLQLAKWVMQERKE